jgi:hypothetical protein
LAYFENLETEGEIDFLEITNSLVAKIAETAKFADNIKYSARVDPKLPVNII